MKAALYLRVSTDEQAREGVSLEMQRDRLTLYALARGWEVGPVFADEASAKSLRRPALTHLLDALGHARRGDLFDAVLIYKLDRLTRRVRDLAELLDRFERSGVALVSLSEAIDSTSATGRLLVNIIGSVAQWEREQIGERTKAAMEHRRRSLLYNGGRPLFGFRVAEGRLVPDPGELAVVRTILAMAATGLRPKAIARQLKTPARGGGAWHHEQVKRILARAELYRGVIGRGDQHVDRAEAEG